MFEKVNSEVYKNYFNDKNNGVNPNDRLGVFAGRKFIVLSPESNLIKRITYRVLEIIGLINYSNTAIESLRVRHQIDAIIIKTRAPTEEEDAEACASLIAALDDAFSTTSESKSTIRVSASGRHLPLVVSLPPGGELEIDYDSDEDTSSESSDDFDIELPHLDSNAEVDSPVAAPVVDAPVVAAPSGVVIDFPDARGGTRTLSEEDIAAIARIEPREPSKKVYYLALATAAVVVGGALAKKFFFSEQVTSPTIVNPVEDEDFNDCDEHVVQTAAEVVTQVATQAVETAITAAANVTESVVTASEESPAVSSLRVVKDLVVGGVILVGALKLFAKNDAPQAVSFAEVPPTPRRSARLAAKH